MFAIIDVGSNSVRLMLWADGKSLYKRINTTRLGEGLAKTGMLSQNAIERTALAVADFAQEARNAGANVADIFVFATAAVRSAKNGEKFCRRVKELCGVGIDVVSGEAEALLGLNGALGTADGGMIDIGGASTEIVLRQEGKISFSVSLDIGAVRLFDSCRDNPEALRQEIERALSPLQNLRFTEKMYAIGGTATTLAAIKLALKEYDGEKIQDCPLSLAEVEKIAHDLLSKTAEERKNIAGMDVRRADIIAGGALLLSEIMKKLSIERVFTSDRDNLEGYLIFRGLA